MGISRFTPPFVDERVRANNTNARQGQRVDLFYQLYPKRMILEETFRGCKIHPRIHSTTICSQLRSRGVVCRESTNECDLPEVCSGETGQCPPDVYKKNGNPCSNKAGFCFNGVCPALNLQCEQVWGYGGVAADQQCFEQFNSKGSINGHCGTDSSGHLLKCEPE